jgi:hypothetical protein
VDLITHANCVRLRILIQKAVSCQGREPRERQFRISAVGPKDNNAVSAELYPWPLAGAWLFPKRL